MAINPQEVQTKIASWKKQLDSAKSRIMRIKVEGEQAEKQLEEVKHKCEELGVDPANIDDAIEENSNEINTLMVDIQNGISELNNAISQLESI